MVNVTRPVWKYGPKDTVARFVLLNLADHADEDGFECYPHVSTIAEECCISRSAVYKALLILQQEGYIKKLWGGGNSGKAVRWQVFLDKLPGSRPDDQFSAASTVGTKRAFPRPPKKRPRPRGGNPPDPLIGVTTKEPAEALAAPPSAPGPLEDSANSLGEAAKEPEEGLALVEEKSKTGISVEVTGEALVPIAEILSPIHVSSTKNQTDVKFYTQNVLFPGLDCIKDSQETQNPLWDFPCRGPQKIWRFTLKEYLGWKAAFPDLDVDQQLRNMRACIESAPQKKTAHGMARFVTNWLIKEQDKAPRRNNANANPTQSQDPNRAVHSARFAASLEGFDRLISKLREQANRDGHSASTTGQRAKSGSQ